MVYDISNNTAYIDGSKGPYSGKPKSANYGANAMHNYKAYIEDFTIDTTAPNPDVFIKGASVKSIRNMEKEVKKLEKEFLPPVDFVLKYAPKMGKIKAFFSRMFTGAAIDRQALLGHSYEEMGRKTHISVEEADAPFREEVFSNINENLTAKAFDVNNDGEIDISEMAVSTVIADVLSKNESEIPPELTILDLKKADGSYTNDGENKMLAFCKEENLETASAVAKDIHSKLKLNKAREKFLKNCN